jgi:ketosteroid isomerase-like protein
MKSDAARLVWLLILAGFAVCAGAQDADEAGIRSKILALEHAWNQAEAFNDLKALDSLFDNRLVYIDSDGTLLTKAEFLAHVKSSHLQQVITQSMSVQVFGDMAIATGTYLVKEFKGGRYLQHRGRFVDAWVRKDRTWVCVAAEATPSLR